MTHPSDHTSTAKLKDLPDMISLDSMSSERETKMVYAHGARYCGWPECREIIESDTVEPMS